MDVAFENKGPVELRVLKPADVDAFIRAQGDLRRAYEAPPTTANPGQRAQPRPQRGALRRAPSCCSPSTRSSASAVAPASARSARLARRAARWPACPRAPRSSWACPAGFTVVRSQWLNLDLGGAERDFSVPGFDTWY